MDLPKYIKVRGGKQLYYRRNVPKALTFIAGKKEVFIPIEATVDSSASQIQTAAAKGQQEYDALLQLYSNSDRDSMFDTNVDAAASAAMRVFGVRDGEVRPERWTLAGMEPWMIEWMCQDAGCSPEELKTRIADGWADQILKQMPETIPEQVKKRIKQRISRKKSTTLKNLSDAFAAYSKLQGWDSEGDSKANRRRLRDWERVMRYTGDHPMLPGLDGTINKALSQLVHDELDRDLSPNSIRRNLASPVACCRWIGEAAHISPWQINMPRLPTAKDKVRDAMSRENQLKLLAHCQDKHDPIAAVLIWNMLGGLASELPSVNDWSTLENRLPHVLTTAGKTTSRPRLVCFPFAADLVRDQLEAGAKWISERPDSGIQSLNKRIRSAIGEHGTTYQLRHSARLSGMGENPQQLASLLGWAGGLQVSEVMLRYGSENMQEQLELLWDTSCRIFGHLRPEHNANVTALPRVKHND